ncbi:ATP synthase F1, gamma subunit [Chloroherpeton thalassium ATCC 35110]|uniref:ATP synthase gamma chain n=1 Tax=Chloroherpeton thalassium (strain ATCC 35110 / GB-78) TaxID=517418 RepID=ATPG_CHLT3|nr:F0F1 ATP synthase subunit gamma [Chloroherpeton thalassium]B3QWX8.1 RecName: Full=ATP synthase gamma chain; AltName: Full=ATP synthase F1 sector gamma subunit; AltName: Full=F-ATPase gamma subunit [Chloroherpeton thalassium ATCC 35110]ACF13342.1 ATP synthase F1, gamma subunit [Chloroherpeton thalassium ATCC 35110]
MATLREIRTRIKSVKSTQQLTKAMKMVAAAKLRRAQDRALQARPYAAKLKELLDSLSGKVDTTINPLLTPRSEVKNVLVILVTSDRGLCGAFNTNIIKMAQRLIDQDYADMSRQGRVKMICAGRRGNDFFRKRGYNVVYGYPNIFNQLDFNAAKEIVEKATELYLSGEVDKVHVIYNEFKNVVSPNLISEVFLPIAPSKKDDAGSDAARQNKLVPIVDYIYEPSPEAIINELVPKHLNTQLWRVLLESNAAEQASRMTAMDSATDNAKELLRSLSITYNRARQAAITKEILEIVGGANALEQSA